MTDTSYYKSISAKGKLAIRQKKAEAESMHQAPLGYRNVRANGRSTMERDPKKYRLVQLAKRMREEGNSINAVCRAMKARGLRSKRGKLIGPSSMHLILGRP
ncbi:MAG: hypothetical protein Q8S00_25565 [Deltaproteobacteria bacterium]|nr:hypothetical protein [Deltaproteobacteria bacterium]